MKKEFKTMTAKQIAEKTGKEAHNNTMEDISSAEKKAMKVLKGSPVAVELAKSVFGFYREALTPELLVKATGFSLRVMSIVMTNAVDLSHQAAAIILSIPQKAADKGIYIEGLSNPKDRPVFIQEYLDEKKGTKLKVVKTAKKNNGLKSMGQELREANDKIQKTKKK